MKITYLGHAGFYIETKDCNIACDPWKFENPQFFGSWFVFPDNSDLDWSHFIENIDYLYVSHVHSDHLDKTFLKELASSNKKVKILLPDYRRNKLKETLQELGFNDFILGGGECGNTKMMTYPSQSSSGEREDSSILVSDEITTFLNVNDSTIDDDHEKDIFSRVSSIDLMACQFSGASFWPLCYDIYPPEQMEELCTGFSARKIEGFFNIIDKLKVKKTIASAGPPCFLEEASVHLNNLGDNVSIFPDSWQVPEFDDREDVYRVYPGDEFTFDTIVDHKELPFNKREYIQSKTYRTNDAISQKEFEESKTRFLSRMSLILNDCSWLNKYILGNIYISITDYETFCLNFKTGRITTIDKIEKEMYYLVKMPSKIFHELVVQDHSDWEDAFLSTRIRFERYPDIYNPWILSFFKNLSANQLERLHNFSKIEEVTDSTITIGDYEVNRYCPHLKYDLLSYGKVDLENKTLQCLGHGWKWNLETGEGINCTIKLKCKIRK